MDAEPTAQSAGTRYDSPEAALQAHWGYASFRGIQRDVIEAVLGGRDALALMPTGGGKSLCYQVPALLRPGVCVVVSPLIALMKDQVAALQRRGVRAAALFGGLHRREQEAIYDRAQFGGLDLLYLSPERLLTDWTRARLGQTDVSLLAVDEAHCISQWGHDFRPAYRQLADLRQLMPGVPVLALTATATPRVADDICEQLGFSLLAERHTMSFTRENLVYARRRVEDKVGKLAKTLAAVPGSAIVYARSRGGTVELARELQRRGCAAAHYHAGMTLPERDAVQEAWREDRTRVVVATNAFGMGIDKPDVRLVVHVDLPDTLEAYFQEAGRAGRDGRRAYALLLYGDADAERLRRQHAASSPTPHFLQRVYHCLGSYCNLAIGGGEGESYDFDVVAFAKTFEFSPLEAIHALRVLQAEGLVYLSEAVYRPAMIALLAQREELYDYRLRNPKLDHLIQALLRTHQGAHQSLVYLKERELSRHLGITPLDLRRQLTLLQRQKIIDYRPQGEAPQLTWTTARMPREGIGVDWRALRRREERAAERLEAAVAYASEERCRPQQLLAYFGEQTEACGQCDVCLAERPESAPVEDKYLRKVEAVLRRQELQPAELLDSFGERHRAGVLAAAERLMNEGAVRERDGRLVWGGSDA